MDMSVASRPGMSVVFMENVVYLSYFFFLHARSWMPLNPDAISKGPVGGL